MAVKSVFVATTDYPFFEEVKANIDELPRLALFQARKNQIGLHQNFVKAFPDKKVLEISSKSIYSFGARLSAMSLRKQASQGATTDESAFQSSRIYKNI